LPAGTAVLGLGDRYRFGDDAVAAGGEVDLVCLDIRDGAVLATPHGSAAARLPILPEREAPSPETSYERVASAPETMDRTRQALPMRAAEGESGVGLVRSASGDAYKVVAARIEEHENALERRVHIRYGPVAVAADGGSVELAEGVAVRAPHESVLGTIRGLLAVPAPFAEDLDWMRVREVGVVGPLPAELTLGPERQLVLTDPLGTALTVTGPGVYSRDQPIGPALVYASRGIAPEGRLALRSWAMVLVAGDLEGYVETNTFSYVRVTGSVRGTIRVRSWCTVVVDGDVHGALDLSSYATVLVRGVVHDPASVKCRGPSTVYLEQPLTSDFAARMGAMASSGTLHLRISDLPPGAHEGIGGWKQVVVADPVWGELGRG
jgi:hypothetical protein